MGRTRVLVAVGYAAKETILMMVDGDLAKLDVEAGGPRLTDFMRAPSDQPRLMMWEGDVSRGEVRDGAGKANGLIWRGAFRQLMSIEWKRLSRGEPPWGRGDATKEAP